MYVFSSRARPRAPNSSQLPVASSLPTEWLARLLATFTLEMHTAQHRLRGRQAHRLEGAPPMTESAKTLSAAGHPLPANALARHRHHPIGQAVSHDNRYAAGYAVVWYITETTGTPHAVRRRHLRHLPGRTALALSRRPRRTSTTARSSGSWPTRASAWCRSAWAWPSCWGQVLPALPGDIPLSCAASARQVPRPATGTPCRPSCRTAPAAHQHALTSCSRAWRPSARRRSASSCTPRWGLTPSCS